MPPPYLNFFQASFPKASAWAPPISPPTCNSFSFLGDGRQSGTSESPSILNASPLPQFLSSELPQSISVGASNITPHSQLLFDLGDGRQSGTSESPSILNASPEAVAGGGLAILRTGDSVVLNLEEGTLNVDLSEAEIASRCVVRVCEGGWGLWGKAGG
jgi:hypothetical protein